MACKSRCKVYLGYEDEYVTEKHRSFVNFATNKIGGKPDLPINQTSSPFLPPVCRLCGLNQLLALQLYAPLDNTRYHRTLYIFTCINPNCWNQNDSWTCLRIQAMEEKCISIPETIPTPPTTSWLAGADDWDDNISEQNGNNLNDSTKLNLFMDNKELSDDLANLTMDDKNANSPASGDSPGGGGGGGVGGGAVGRLDSPQASAEIEGEESELVTIDTPTKPQINVIELLQESTINPFQHEESKNLTFAEIFIGVDEEDLSADVSQHVRELFVEYQRKNPDVNNEIVDNNDDKDMSDGGAVEKYEKCLPKHGDEMFHNFLTRIQRNPGQLLRYCRDNSAPLLLSHLSPPPTPCKYCGAERIFEVQILPTIIRKLILVPSIERNFELEFGTVLIYTCSRSCWLMSDTFKEEYVVVQAERL